MGGNLKSKKLKPKRRAHCGGGADSEMETLHSSIGHAETSIRVTISPKTKQVQSYHGTNHSSQIDDHDIGIEGRSPVSGTVGSRTGNASVLNTTSATHLQLRRPLEAAVSIRGGKSQSEGLVTIKR